MRWWTDHVRISRAKSGRYVLMEVKATIAANTRYRRQLNISAYEMHTSRSQDTGENIVMDDSKLYGDQMSRRSQHRIGQPQIDIRVGDTVTPISSQPKHKSRDMYIVTAAADQSVSAQKILHPLQNKPTKLMSRIYNTDPKNVQLIHRPPAAAPSKYVQRPLRKT